MRDSRLIVLSPVVTEKSTEVTERSNAYTFKVAPESNRIEIKRAIEDLFDVKVKKVNTLSQVGKSKRFGRNIGVTKGYKKAVITLLPGYKIDVF